MHITGVQFLVFCASLWLGLTLAPALGALVGLVWTVCRYLWMRTCEGWI